MSFLPLELDANHLAAEPIAHTVKDLGQRPRAAFFQRPTGSFVVVVIAVFSIIGMGEAAACQHNRERKEDYSSRQNGFHSTG